MLPSLFRAMSGLGPDDEAAFDRHAGELARDLGVLMAVFMLVATVGWWPLDALVQSEPRYVEVFAGLRQWALGIELLALGIMFGLRPRGRAALWAGAVLYALLLGSFGHHLGRLGAVDYLADAYIGIVPVAWLPVRLRARIAATFAIGGALGFGFFGLHPENLALPSAWAQLSFLVFAILFTITLGELVFRVLRRAFFQQRALNRANEALSALTDSLSQRVAEKTAALRGLAVHLDAVQERERRRIARDLHDDLGQSLTAMRYTIARLEARLRSDPASASPLVEDLSALVDGTSETVRGFLTELRPRVLDDLGLVAAAEWLCDRISTGSGIECRLDVGADFPDGVELPGADAALVLFRALQEATTNALKHGRAGRIEVRLRADADTLSVEVEDDGAGFDPEAPTHGFGLLGLRERVRASGGALALDAAPGRGTRLTVSLPRAGLRADNEDAGVMSA